MRDISKNLSAVISIDPQSIATDTTTNGVAVDVRDFGAAMVLFASNDAITDGDYALTVEESDASGSGFTTVAAADLIGTLTDFSSSAEGIQQVGYIGTKRYIRAVITSTSTSTGGLMSATIVKGRPYKAPTS